MPLRLRLPLPVVLTVAPLTSMPAKLPVVTGDDRLADRVIPPLTVLRVDAEFKTMSRLVVSDRAPMPLVLRLLDEATLMVLTALAVRPLSAAMVTDWPKLIPAPVISDRL